MQAVSDTLWVSHRLCPDYVAAQTVEQAMPLERLDIVDCDVARSEVATFSYLPTGRSCAALRGLAINLALGRDR